MTKYMSVFIKKAANETLNALENEKFRKIDIAKLMPALMDCPDEARPRARRFVEDHCIKQRRSTESSVHNMCFYLYAKSENSDDLIDFLRKEEVNHNNHQTIFFDVTYALNVCKQMQKVAFGNRIPGNSAWFDERLFVVFVSSSLRLSLSDSLFVCWFIL